jgi:FtsP/CotA-like multicopper oxidase with cupredoxin domain
VSDRTKLGFLGAFAGFCVVIAFGIGVIASAAFNTDKPTVAVAGASSDEQVLQVELGDLFIKPVKLTAEAGPLTIEVHNGGAAEHNFAIDGVAKTPMLGPDESYTLEIDEIEAGTYTYICEVSGHADGGMKGTLEVGGGGSGTATHDMSAMSAREMAEHDAAVTASFPAETKGHGGEVLEPKMDGDTKVFELTASVIRWEVEPGEIKEAWAYNGAVPGPQIKANLGDKIRIVLHNELPEPTTIHFHGMTVPAGMDGVPVISQDAVLPGKSFTYEFTIRNTGSNMYHSHFNAQKQVPMGLLGTMVIADPDDPQVDHDYTMVLNDGPLGFTLNGKGFPATEPLAVTRGDLVRVRYMNEGLQIHPMHLHGMPQEVIAVDGHMLDDPYMKDTVMVAPGERVDVLVRATESGIWAWHCHILNHAESPDGMFGMVTALIVE